MAPLPRQDNLFLHQLPPTVDQVAGNNAEPPPLLHEGVIQPEVAPTANTTVPGAVVGGGKKKKKITIIHCWTAPRSRSTALLYSFEARGKNCVAIDEPLKREWLIYQGDRVHRPYKANMIDGIPINDDADDFETFLWQRETMSLEARLQDAVLKLNKTLDEDISSDIPTNNQDDHSEGVVFCKHMSKTYFLYDFENELDSVPGVEGIELVHKHMFLVRDPVAILRSWDALSSVHNEACATEDVGIVPLLAIFLAHQKRSPDSSITVLDSDALVVDPEGMLKQKCLELGISYQPSMMTWEDGPHDCDSRHAPWWYKDAHKSTGWKRAENTAQPSAEKEKPAPKPINPKLFPALRDSVPAYEFIMRHSVAM